MENWWQWALGGWAVVQTLPCLLASLIILGAPIYIGSVVVYDLVRIKLRQWRKKS